MNALQVRYLHAQRCVTLRDSVALQSRVTEQLQNTRPSEGVSRIYCSRGPAVRNDLTMWQVYE